MLRLGRTNVIGTLKQKVALVAGASRGCGRGIALALGDAGCTVYVTGRSIRGGAPPRDKAPGTVEDTADEVTRRGGTGIALQVDHTDAGQVERLFDRIHAENGRLDIACCAVWGGNERYMDSDWNQPFWEQPVQCWDEFLDTGPYAFWLLAREACRMMTDQGSGLIAGVSEPMLKRGFEGQQASLMETLSHLAHYSLNRLVGGLAPDATGAGIAIVGLLPGFMKTERVEMHLNSMGESAREQFRYDLAESPEYAGRAICALAADAHVLSKSGKLHFVADLAEDYGFTDVDGKQVANFYRTLGMLS